MYVGIDIGGTRCRVLTAHNLGRIEKRDRHEFVLSHDFDVDIAKLIATIHRFVPTGDVQAIGLSIPGGLNSEKSMILHAKNLAEWSGVPLKQIMEQEFHCQFFLENDGVAAALGEAHFGQGSGKNFCFLIWGTGIGGAKVQYGQKITSDMLDWNKYFELWERDCGGNALQKQFGKDGGKLTETEWGAVMQKFRVHLMAFIAATGTTRIIFGGGVAIKQRERLLALAPDFPNVELLVSGLGEDAGLYGALALLEPSKA